MARTLRAVRRPASWEAEENYDRYLELFAAIVRQSQRDVTLPVRGTFSNSLVYPTPQEQLEARDFLKSLGVMQNLITGG